MERIEADQMSPSVISADMRETNRIFEEDVVAGGMFSELRRVYTTQARVLPPGSEMISGPENIEEFWKQAVASLGVKSARLKTLDLETAGDMAFETGRAELGTASGAMIVKYVVVWKREEGVWKWHIDCWNAVS
jgi:ketosteroid isomerase-like protein